MSERWIGIDVAKARLDLVELPTGTHWTAPNTAAGWEQLCAEVRRDPPTGIVVAATGQHHVGITVALDAVGLIPVVVNPLTLSRVA